MKYRIREQEGKYRAEIGKENRFGRLDWNAIENDNFSLVDSTYLYNTVEEAVEACKNHHTEKGYDKIGQDIVKEFEL